MQGKTVMANLGRRVLTGSEQGVVVGTSQEAVTGAMQVPYSNPPSLEEASSVHEEAKTRLEVCWACPLPPAHPTPPNPLR